MSHPSLLRSCFVVILAGCLSLPLSPPPSDVSAQMVCPYVPRAVSAPGTLFWRAGATVATVVDSNSNFRDEELAAVVRAIENWNEAKAAEGNNSNVTISTDLQLSAMTPDIATAVPIMYIKKGPLEDTAVARMESNSNTHPFTSIARITINQTINWLTPYDPTGWSLTSTMAHEMGHTFNLGDCYPTCDGVSVMGARNCNNIVDGQPVDCVLAPTACDNCYVNSYCNYPPRSFARRRYRRPYSSRGTA